MDYICYISRSKVDSLHTQLDPQRYEEILERVGTEQNRAGICERGRRWAAC